MNIPQKINPCPIVEAIVEIRFDSEMPSDAVFGVLYNEFRSEFKNVEKLPILQFPEIVRTKDPNLKFQPHYKLHHQDFMLQIGPNVLSVANVNKYVGWNNFSSKILNIFLSLEKLSVVKKIDRLGIRYINFFELDIYKEINLKFFLAEKPFEANQITLRSTISTGKFYTNLHILNNANITTKNMESPQLGSLVDIDTYIQEEKELSFSKIESLLEEGHLEEKKLFFKLLQDDFLEKFNPEY